MTYLFFDIECADGDFKICEFGYVITDESFNILTKKNILINPQCSFNLTGREGQKDLILSYPYEEYYKHPTFEEMHDNIRFLMTRDDMMIFGHAVKNDIGFLDKSCRYRKVDRFDYVAYDTQKILRDFSRVNKIPRSLDKAFLEIVPEEERQGLIPHRACDDAEETMLVLKWMTKALGFTVKDIVDACPDCKVHAFEYLVWKKENDRKRQATIREKAALKKGNEIFRTFFEPYQRMWEDPNNVGKFVTLSMRLKQNEKALTKAISLIGGSQFVPVEKTPGSDYLIALDSEDIVFIQESLRHPYSGRVLTLEEFAELAK